VGIVRFALRFRHTFYVLALAILLLGVSAAVSTPKVNPPVDAVDGMPVRLEPAMAAI